MADFTKAKDWIKDADAIIVTAGNGMAKEEGLDILSEKNFDSQFDKIAEKYDVHTIGDALDKRFDSWSKQWEFWSKLINEYSLKYQPSKTMRALKLLLQNKEYFIATSTFAHFFEYAGFNEKRIFNVFGDWTKMQCSSGINHGQKDDQAVVKKFIEEGASKALVPRCEICHSEMELHIPLNAHFYPDTDANARLRWFLTAHEDKKVVILELGVDQTSPQLLDPMIKLVEQFDQWKYFAADLEPNNLPDRIKNRSLAFNTNSANFLEELIR